MTHAIHKHHGFLIGLVAVMIVALVPAIAAASNPKIPVTVGQSVTQRFGEKVKTVSIADSDVADVVVAGPQEVLINGKTIGLTTMVVWDEFNVSKIFDVVVRGPFSDQKIELRVQVAEVNRTKARDLGFDWYGTAQIDGDQLQGALFGGPVASPSIPLSIFGNGASDFVNGAFRYVTGGDELQMMFRALVTNGVLTVLAEPNVVAASGAPASFLSGGEIPVPIAASGTTGGSTVTIEWKEFGIKVDFLPTIVDSGVVNLHVAPEVSSLDYNNAIRISGFDIPAIRSRKAETTVELRDREILVIGGLLMEETTSIRSRIPILGHIPILGYLFSNEEKVTSQNELMLVVSPHIVRALPPGTPVKLPTDAEQDTN